MSSPSNGEVFDSAPAVRASIPIESDAADLDSAEFGDSKTAVLSLSISDFDGQSRQAWQGHEEPHQRFPLHLLQPPCLLWEELVTDLISNFEADNGLPPALWALCTDLGGVPYNQRGGAHLIFSVAMVSLPPAGTNLTGDGFHRTVAQGLTVTVRGPACHLRPERSRRLEPCGRSWGHPVPSRTSWKSPR